LIDIIPKEELIKIFGMMMQHYIEKERDGLKSSWHHKRKKNGFAKNIGQKVIINFSIQMNLNLTMKNLKSILKKNKKKNNTV